MTNDELVNKLREISPKGYGAMRPTTIRTDGLLASEEMKQPDPIRPPHYQAHPSGVECIVVAEHFNFCLGNTIKYIWRAGQKGNAIEDLKKARWYLDHEINRLEDPL